MKDLPFNFYEFVAILMPGFIITTIIYIPIAGSIPNFSLDNVLYCLFLICISYVAGQILGHLSFSTLDKFTKKVLGEPALILLGNTKAGKIKSFLFPGYFSRTFTEQDKNKLFGLLNTKNDKELIHKIYTSVLSRAKSDKEILERLGNWSRLFGFSRNLSFGFIIVSIYFFINDFKYSWLTLLLSVFMYYRYLRFFSIYSEELLQWFKEKNVNL